MQRDVPVSWCAERRKGEAQGVSQALGLAVRQPAQHQSQIGVVRVEQDEAREEVRPRPIEGGAVRIEVSLHRIVIDRQDNVRALGEEGGECDFNGAGHEKS